MDALGSRLRALRTGWEGVKVTQRHVAQALDASGALVSAWENGKAVPPPDRLQAYARFFATPRSLAKGTGRLLPNLSADEEQARVALLDELTALAADPVADPPAGPVGVPSLDGSFWHLPDQQITILCTGFTPRQLGLVDGKLPPEPQWWQQYAVNEYHPNAVQQLRNADIDSLLELVGHLRAVNPLAEVRWMLTGSLQDADPQFISDQLSGHLVVLGGGDQRSDEPTPGHVLADLFVRWQLPVRLGWDDFDEEYGGFFRHGGKEYRPQFWVPDQSDPASPRMRIDGAPHLVHDVALLARAANPYHSAGTVTVCTGIFSRGTYGAVRAFTDAQKRVENEQHLAAQVDPADFWLVTRVPVAGRGTVTPTLAPDPGDLLASS